MSMPKPILLALLACGLSACSLVPPQPISAIQPVLRTGQSANRVAEWNQLARHHLERGQINLAMGAYAQSLALDAGQLEARNAVAVIEAQKGQLTLARQDLISLTRDYPGEAMPYTNLGYVYYLEGDFANAKRTLQRAMALGGGSKAFQNLQMAENAARLAAAAPELESPAANAEPIAVPILAAAPVPLTRLAVATAATPSATTTPRNDAAFATVTADDVAPAPAAAAATARATAPAIVAAPATTIAAALEPAPAAVAPAPRAPRPQTPSITEPQLAARVELVQLAPSIFELKQNETPAAPAPVTLAHATLPPAVPAAVLARTSQAQPAPGQSAQTQAALAQASRTAEALAQASRPPVALAQASRPPAAAAPLASASQVAPTLTQASVPPLGTPPAALTSAVLTPSPGRSASAPRDSAPREAVRSAKMRLEIANGNGTNGLAKRFRAVLSELGIVADRLSNDKPYRQVTTTIQYSPGFEKQAASLQQALQGKAQLASQPLQGSDVRLVLGKDAPESLAGATDAAGEAASASLMASTPPVGRRRN